MNYPSYYDSLRADIQPSYKDSLAHHGIKGMHWGVRRYQNPDGTLNDAGQKRYNKLADRGDKLRAKGKNNSIFTYNQLAINASKQRESSEEYRKKQKALLKQQEESYRKAQKDRENAFKKVYGEDAKLDYMKIYTEMSKDKRFKNLLKSEDPDDYRAAEAAWRKKHSV